MSTSSDIKSSLEGIRHKKVPSKISITEDKLKKELTDYFGDILGLRSYEIAEIEKKERRRFEAHELALKRGRLKAFKMQEKARVLQEIRSRVMEEVRSSKRKSGGTMGRYAKVKPRSKLPRERNIDEIIFEY